MRPYLFVAIVGLLVFAIRRGAAEPRPADSVDIRGDDGKSVLVACDDIRLYDWSTHTVTLAPSVKEKLASDLRGTTKLVSGVPFSLCIAGRPIYAGVFTTVASSFSHAKPTIVVDLQSIDSQLGKDQLRIQLGYPTEKFFRGQDPRGNLQLRNALRAENKLAKASTEHTKWIAESLLEIQTLKPGMTRRDLRHVFEEEGGLSTPLARRYAYRDCPYIKVDVTFHPSTEPGERSERPGDTIKTISAPFLEWSIVD